MLRILGIITLLMVLACIVISASIAVASDVTADAALEAAAVDVYEFDGISPHVVEPMAEEEPLTELRDC